MICPRMPHVYNYYKSSKTKYFTTLILFFQVLEQLSQDGKRLSQLSGGEEAAAVEAKIAETKKRLETAKDGFQKRKEKFQMQREKSMVRA